MKHISLDQATKSVKEFVRSLPDDREGVILELDGKPLLKVTPVADAVVDKRKLRAAIRKRRDESRALNQDWAAVDRETWEQPRDKQE